MVPPSPDLQRKYRNTDEVVRSGRSYLISELVDKYPCDYINLATYYAIKNRPDLHR